MMPTLRLLAASAAALALALPSAAQAGTVTGFPPVYGGSDVPETVNAFTSGGLIVLEGDEVLLGGGAHVRHPNPIRPGSIFQPCDDVVRQPARRGDRIDASMLTGTNLVADGGLGGDYILDGAGNDTIIGGPGATNRLVAAGRVQRRRRRRHAPTTRAAARRSRSASTARPCPAGKVRLGENDTSAPTSRAPSAARATT